MNNYIIGLAYAIYIFTILCAVYKYIANKIQKKRIDKQNKNNFIFLMSSISGQFKINGIPIDDWKIDLFTDWFDIDDSYLLNIVSFDSIKITWKTRRKFKRVY